MFFAIGRNAVKLSITHNSQKERDVEKSCLEDEDGLVR